jgi:hypothetical protein
LYFSKINLYFLPCKYKFSWWSVSFTFF